MIQRYFFDTSALIKLYHQESGSKFLDQMIQSDKPRIVISSICVVEIISALSKKMRMKTLKLADFDEAITLFEFDLSKFEVIQMDSATQDVAYKLVKAIGPDHNLRTLNAFQLASAIRSAQLKNLPQGVFIVSDKALAEVASLQKVQDIQNLRVLLIEKDE